MPSTPDKTNHKGRGFHVLLGKTWKKTWRLEIGLLVLLGLLVFFSLGWGRYSIPASEIGKAILSSFRPDLFQPSDLASVILLEIRLPRVLAAICIGAALSISGAAYQGIFRNSMVSPDLLGATAGAGFGAALGILLGWGILATQLVSFAFGLGAVLLTSWIGAWLGRREDQVLSMILCGIMVSSVFAALISITKLMADPNGKLPAITFWLMGGLNTLTARDLKIALAPMVLGAFPLFLIRWRLDILTQPDEEALALGLNPGRLRLLVIVCATLMTSASVSICGMVGWIGLVIPHWGRLLTGPSYRQLLPVAGLLGGAYLLGMDDLARLPFSTEIPLGILTSLMGAPFFIFLLARARRS